VPRALILGRFQPPHLGHLDVIAKASARFERVLVVVGSAQDSYTPQNPFTGGERVEMLQAALAERGLANVDVYPVVDLNRHAQWVAYLQSLLPPFDTVVTNNPLTKALFEAGGVAVEEGELHDRKNHSGTNVRGRLAKGRSIDHLVPPSVAAILERLDAGARLRTLTEAHDD
jgi:nicotinamide-nucleotide adenylyltransferase